MDAKTSSCAGNANLCQRVSASARSIGTGDITLIPTAQGWLYIEVCYNRQRLHASLDY